MILGYFAFEATIMGYGLAAAGAIPGNAIQGTAGIVIAPLFIYIYSFHCSSFLRFGACLSFLNGERLSLPRIGINIVAITIPAVP